MDKDSSSVKQTGEGDEAKINQNFDLKADNSQEELFKFLQKVDKAAKADGEVDPIVMDTIKTWMKDLKDGK